MTASEPITLREYVILSGILGTTDLVRAWRWVDASAHVLELPEPLLGTFGREPMTDYSERVESYLRTWTRMLQAASAAPHAPSRHSPKLNRLQREAREVCDGALASLLGTSWLSALLWVDDAMDASPEAQLHAAEELVRSGIQEVVARPDFAAPLRSWATRDAVSFGVALSKLGSLVDVLTGEGLRHTVDVVGRPCRLGRAITDPVLAILARPGILAAVARHETFFEGAHEVLVIAATAGQRPELLEAAMRVLEAGVNWAAELGDSDARSALQGRLDAFVAVYLPLPDDPRVATLRQAVERHAMHWDNGEYELLAPPKAWTAPKDHTAAAAPWAVLHPAALQALISSPAACAHELQAWIAGNAAEEPDAARSAVLALGQLGDPASRDALESLANRKDEALQCLRDAIGRARRVITAAPADEGYPELARQWLIDVDAARVQTRATDARAAPRADDKAPDGGAGG